MGSSRSKPRKGHKKQRHLPKVGSPANMQHKHETREDLVFGTGLKPVLLAVVVVLVIIGLLLLTL